MLKYMLNVYQVLAVYFTWVFEFFEQNWNVGVLHLYFNPNLIKKYNAIKLLHKKQYASSKMQDP
jgi:hypothetical protein